MLHKYTIKVTEVYVIIGPPRNNWYYVLCTESTSLSVFEKSAMFEILKAC